MYRIFIIRHRALEIFLFKQNIQSDLHNSLKRVSNNRNQHLGGLAYELLIQIRNFQKT